MKKILSVMLSLLMIFTTISVVFTLPASAKTVTYTVFEEDFEGFNIGDAPAADYEATWKQYDEGANGYFKGGLPAENGWFAASTTAKNSSIIAQNTDTTNTTKHLSTPAWGGIGVSFAVSANTTYTISFKEYCALSGSANYARNAIVNDISDVTEGFSFKTGLVANYDNTAVPELLNVRGSMNPGAVWHERSFTFTTDDDATKAAFFFKTDYEGYLIDDIKVTYSVEVGVPVVTTTTTGADDKNGGVAWVEETNDGFVFKAVPYETATFTGWFRNGQLVSEEATLAEDLNTATNIEARFNATYKNIFPEGSFEDEIALGASDTPAASNALFWGTGLPADGIKAIGANDWVGQSWAGIVVASNAFINAKIDGLTAYTGTKAAYIPRNNNHTNYKVVRGLKTNTDYYLTYYIYQDKASAFNPNDSANNGIISYCATGIPTGATTVLVNDMNLQVAGTTGQTRIPYEYISDARTATNAWTKHSVKFNTGNHTDVAINFCADGGNVFIDHVSLYYKPSPEITVTTVGQGTNGGIAWTDKAEALPGEELTYSAKAYANAEFIGWYKNGSLYVTDETFTESYDPSDTYEARFNAFATNLDTNGSGETYQVGELMEGSAHRSPWGEITTNAYVIINNNFPEIAKMYYGKLNVNNTKAYSGTKALENLTGSHGFFKIYDVEPNSTYHFSYYYYQDSVKLEAEGGYSTFPDAALIADDATNIYIKGGSNVSNILIANNAAGQVITDLFIDTPNVYYKKQTVVGEWTEVRYTFLTGENGGKVVIPMPTATGVLFDHFTLYKENDFESSYSFAVVPDTQKFNDDRPLEGESGTNDYNINEAYAKLYDDILAKKDDKNIQMVISLGDITENSFESEYNNAKAQFDRLDAANLPYTVLQGNHDYLSQFKNNIPYEQYKSTAAGSFNGIANTYHKFTVGNVKYLVLALQYGATDDVLDWAAKVVSANPDYNVIVTTHGYLKANGQRLNENDGHSPGSAGSPDEETGKYPSSGLNHSSDIWTKFISKHENIVMVLSGHIEYDGVRITESYGDNGNKVLEMLIDGQGLDERARNENLQDDETLADVAYGLVAYFNFSEDGSKLNIEYYSTNLEKLHYEITIDVPVVNTAVETLTVVAGDLGNVDVNEKVGNHVEYKAVAGTIVTLTAKPYHDGEFLGWYDGENPISTDISIETTIATKTITAKFKENNAVVDSSFEHLEVGDTPDGLYYDSSIDWATVKVVDSVDFPRDTASTHAASGEKMLAIKYRNTKGLYFEVDVDQYADYTLSLKWLLTLAEGELQYNEADVVSRIKHIAIGKADQTQYEAGKMIAEISNYASNGLWKQEIINFSSGRNEKIRIFIEYEVGAASQYGVANGTDILYIDDFAVIKTAQHEAPTYILGDVDGNGEVNGKDLTTLRRYLADWDVTVNSSLEALDVNKDNDITGKDITHLARYFAEWDGYTLD